MIIISQKKLRNEPIFLLIVLKKWYYKLISVISIHGFQIQHIH